MAKNSEFLTRAGEESNWVPTSASGKFEVLFKLYGPEKPLFDKTLGDAVRTADDHRRVLVFIEHLYRPEALAGIGQRDRHRSGIEVEHRPRIQRVAVGAHHKFARALCLQQSATSRSRSLLRNRRSATPYRSLPTISFAPRPTFILASLFKKAASASSSTTASRLRSTSSPSMEAAGHREGFGSMMQEGKAMKYLRPRC